jgi:ATP-dependent DNA ligase
MSLPLRRPYPPMEAQLVDEIPSGPGWQYEPKWDGFRCLVFRDGQRVDLQSKSGQPLGRYFPEIVEAARALRPRRYVLDGEIVISVGQGAHRTFSFEDLLQRIHPAASRVMKLSAQFPALVIVFDLLVDERGKPLVSLSLTERRKKLEAFAPHFGGGKRFRLSPATRSVAKARRWLEASGSDLDGIVAKRTGEPYHSGDRQGMQKVKRLRTADCVVGGFRYATGARVVGSLLLGLYDREGLLNHVGFTSGFSMADRKALLARLRPLIQPPGFTGAAPGGPSRWSTERSGAWVPLAPRLVVEVQYDRFTGGRFRHGTRFLRWRPDKSPRQCTTAQLPSGARLVIPFPARGAPSRPR